MLDEGGRKKPAGLESVFPEVGAGGFTRLDGSIEFWSRVGALIRDSDRVVDLGAGRGKFMDDQVEYRRALHDLKPRCMHLLGLDVDPAVFDNQAVHESRVIERGKPFPVEDDSVDMVVSDWTFEHILDPAAVSSELNRILRAGGWICARTPNLWGPVAAPSRMVPNRLHASILKILQPNKKEIDTFPTAYKLNSRTALKKWFPSDQFEHFVYTYESEPSYVGRSEFALRLAILFQRLLPRRAGSTLMIFLQKRE